MSRAVDGELLAERTATVLAHLDRVAATISGVLGTDAVDLVDLSVASALLRFRAAHLPENPAELRPMSSPTDTGATRPDPARRPAVRARLAGGRTSPSRP